MKRALVIYKSVYGSTEKYAGWIAEELKCDMVKKEDAGKINMDDYDVIIYGGGMYAEKVNGIDFLVSSFEKIKDKQVILFTCGLADPNIEKNRANILKGVYKSFTEEMKRSVRVFCFRGGIDYSKLSFVHRAMMSMMYKIISKKCDKDPRALEENGYFLETYGKAVDFSDRKTIETLIEYVKG